ncbi:MAG: rbgA [Firmicutes bacterium]|nr:rbgA [Bacillota bacterium]
MDINWYPGHMAKASRMIREQLKLVDVVIELLDARIPLSSANPVIEEIIAGKPRIVALNKADLADPRNTELWLSFFRGKGIDAIAVNSIGGKGCKELIVQTEKAAQSKLQSLAAKGVRPRAVRAMILGIPNVGKSSLINRLRGSAVARTADKPGVTRGKQWIKISKNLEILDTPGVLWPKLEDQEAAFRLAATGAINDEVFDREEVVNKLVSILRIDYLTQFVSRYRIIINAEMTNQQVLEQIGIRRGCLRSGGLIDVENAGRILLTEFRAGLLGPITLDSFATE